MNSLNTQDFIDSYKQLHVAKYPSLPDTAYVTLASYLRVSLEFGLSVEATQYRLDEKTSEMKTELTHYLAEKAGI